MAKLSLSAMEGILREAGAERVSKAAKMALALAIQNKGAEISKKAARFARHSGRKTITEKDIEMALNSPEQKDI